MNIKNKQKDLLYITSVLVSTSTNANDDHFLGTELYDAVVTNSTVQDKPVNWEHQQEYIIGHMTKAFIVKKGESEPIEDLTLDNLPEDFDVICNGVVYKFIRTAEAEKLTDENSDLCVSMEAFFSDYDYLVGEKIIKRNIKTSFLDKYLRANGGIGVYGGKRVKRVLRKLVFCGKGIVENPANPDSVIKSVANEACKKDTDFMSKNETKPEVIDEATVNEESDAAEELKAELEQIKSEKEALAVTLTGKDGEIKELESKVDEILKEKESMSASLKESEKSLEDLTSKVEKMEKDSRLKERIEILASTLEIETDSEIMATMKKSVYELTDDEFNAYIEERSTLLEYHKEKISAETEEKPESTENTEAPTETEDEEVSDEALSEAFNQLKDSTASTESENIVHDLQSTDEAVDENEEMQKTFKAHFEASIGGKK